MYIWLVFYRELERERERWMLHRLHRLPRPCHPQSLRIIHSFLLSQLSLWPNSSRSSPPGIFSISILSFLFSFIGFFFFPAILYIGSDSGFVFFLQQSNSIFYDGVCVFRLNFLWFCSVIVAHLLSGFGLAQILKWIWTVLETYEVNLIKFFF